MVSYIDNTLDITLGCLATAVQYTSSYRVVCDVLSQHSEEDEQLQAK